MQRDWDRLVLSYLGYMINQELSQEQKDAIRLVFRAARAISLEWNWLEHGLLGEAVHEIVVLYPNWLYHLAWNYPFRFACWFGLVSELEWPAPPDYWPIDWLYYNMPARDWSFFSEALDRIAEDPEEIPSVIFLVQETLPLQLAESLDLLERTIETLVERVRQEVSEISEKLYRTELALSPMQSEFVEGIGTWNPEIRIKGGPEGTPTVVPQPGGGGYLVNSREIKVKANVFDLICTCFQILFAYLGADELPRPWLPADADPQDEPQWQINSIADLISQLHAEFRENSLVDAEVRTGVDGDRTEQIKTNLGTALGLIMAAVKELSLDSERNLAISTQGAQAALSTLAAVGTKTVVGDVDLGFRGKIPVPVTTGASIAQQLQALETLCSAIALQLGVSLERGR